MSCVNSVDALGYQDNSWSTLVFQNQLRLANMREKVVLERLTANLTTPPVYYLDSIITFKSHHWDSVEHTSDVKHESSFCSSELQIPHNALFRVFTEFYISMLHFF